MQLMTKTKIRFLEMTSLRFYKKAPNSQKPAGGQIDEYFHAASVWNKRVARKTPLESTAQHRRLYFISIYFNCNRYITGELQTSEMHQSTRLNSYKTLSWILVVSRFLIVQFLLSSPTTMNLLTRSYMYLQEDERATTSLSLFRSLLPPCGLSCVHLEIHDDLHVKH